jgi:hypothetical protein
MNAPGQLMRSGLTKDMLKLGVLITAEGYRAKDGSNNANSQKITLPDQKSVVTSTSGDTTGDKSKN